MGLHETHWPIKSNSVKAGVPQGLKLSKKLFVVGLAEK